MNAEMPKSGDQNKLMNFIDWILRWRWPIVVGTLVIVFLIASGAQFLRFDTNYRVFFGDDNPQLQTFPWMLLKS
jgi:predicted RND superfamily exporter protein